jgi:hypothetical protein
MPRTVGYDDSTNSSLKREAIMNVMHRILCIATVSIMCLAPLTAFAVITNPTPQRAYVSLQGLDINNCGPNAPCRTFQAALAQVNPDGEVLVLNSGAYGSMSITQGVTVVAPPGIYAGISVFPGSDGITINAPGAKVVLKGLTINGQGGKNGIQIVDAAEVRVENSVIANFNGGGLDGRGIRTTAGNATAPRVLAISGSVLRGNTEGVEANPTGATTIAQKTSIDNSKFEGNGAGVTVYDGVDLAISHTTFRQDGFAISVASYMPAGVITLTGDGLDMSATYYDMILGYYGSGSGLVKASLIRSTISNAPYTGYGPVGIYTDGAGVTLRLAETQIVNCSTGVWVGAGSVVKTLGNNLIDGNATDVNGTLTSLAPK